MDTKRCPYCAEEIRSEAIKCRFCGSMLAKPPVETAAETVVGDSRGTFLLLVPALGIAAALTAGWLKSSSLLWPIGFVVVLATAAMGAFDASRRRTDEGLSGAAVFAGTMLLWVVVYPAYMFHRVRRIEGARRYGLPALVLAVAFMGSVLLIPVLDWMKFWGTDALADYNTAVVDMSKGPSGYGLAEQRFRLAIEKNPEFALAHLNLAVICLEQERIKEAEEHARRATETIERSPITIPGDTPSRLRGKAWAILAMSQAAALDPASAVTSAQRSLQEDPDGPLAPRLRIMLLALVPLADAVPAGDRGGAQEATPPVLQEQEQPSHSKQEAGSGIVPLSLRPEGLRAASYYLPVLERTAKLTNGSWRGREDDTDINAELLEDHLVYADLNSDGVQDAVVVVSEYPGGNHMFRSLGVMFEEQGAAKEVATLELDDGEIRALRVERNQIRIDMTTHGPDDPRCCPTQRTTAVYELQELPHGAWRLERRS